MHPLVEVMRRTLTTSNLISLSSSSSISTTLDALAIGSVPTAMGCNLLLVTSVGFASAPTRERAWRRGQCPLLRLPLPRGRWLGTGRAQLARAITSRGEMSASDAKQPKGIAPRYLPNPLRQPKSTSAVLWMSMPTVLCATEHTLTYSSPNATTFVCATSACQASRQASVRHATIPSTRTHASSVCTKWFDEP